MEPDGSFKDKISFELEKNAIVDNECRHVGMLSVKTANRSVEDALKMPDPVDLYHGLLNEGEVACLFADSNAGKSIFAVQMGDYISRYRKVLYVDCELSEKQFQLRYTNKEMGYRHVFSDNFYRAEVYKWAVVYALRSHSSMEQEMAKRPCMTYSLLCEANHCQICLREEAGHYPMAGDKGFELADFFRKNYDKRRIARIYQFLQSLNKQKGALHIAKMASVIAIAWEKHLLCK